MKVIIKKSLDLVVDIPEARIKEYFGENPSEQGFVQWLGNLYIEPPSFDEYKEDPIESYITREEDEKVTIENAPNWIESEYTKEHLDEINEEIEDAERCYECSGYGDDYSTDEDGNLVSNCDNCPFNK